MTPTHPIKALLPIFAILAVGCIDGTSDPPDGTDAGTISVAVVTSGVDFDPNGYLVSVDGGGPEVVPANGTLTTEDIPPGLHALTLTDVDENRSLEGATPIDVSVAAGSRTTVTLHVVCSYANVGLHPERHALRHLARPGIGSRPVGEDYESLSWSRDGSTLALIRSLPGPIGPGSTRPFMVFLADADGGHARQLQEFVVTHLAPPVWSPDGNTLLLESCSRFCLGTILRLSISGDNLGTLSADDAAPVPCRGGYFAPSWSPDGSSIAVEVYSSEALCVLTAGGAFDRILTSEAAGPNWSPDGALIAFTRLGEPTPDGSVATTIHTLAPDGTGERNLTPPEVPPRDASPGWSPDGGELTFTVLPELNSGQPPALFVMNRDGGNRIQLAPDALPGATWSPDGAQIAFIGPGGLTLVRPDGTGLRVLVSTEGTGSITSYAWRP
jgi:WD40 repeat protein